jgi:hypothetical protein
MDILGNISESNPVTTSGTLDVTLTVLGKTLKLIDLPVYPPAPGEPNTVFKKYDFNTGEYQLMVTG